MTVRILADSYNVSTKTRFTSFLITFPKVLLAELNTHRQAVRSVSSSRAITIERMIEKVVDTPFMPQFTLKQKGMSGNENIPLELAEESRRIWLAARDSAVDYTQKLNQLGIHKQNANRLLDTFSQVDLLISATDWENFFTLRTAPEAQPEFRAIAVQMKRLYDNNIDKLTILQPGEWHIPFGDKMPDTASLETQLKIAVARCARISYETHDGFFSVEQDLALYDRLLANKHYSPFEHVAKAIPSIDGLTLFHNKNQCILELPTELKNKLYVLEEDTIKTVKWTRQYSGFYTYRHHIQDNVPLNLS